MVVIGLDAQYVYLNDPEFDVNPIQVSRGDFDLAWFEHGEFYAVLLNKEPKWPLRNNLSLSTT